MNNMETMRDNFNKYVMEVADALNTVGSMLDQGQFAQASAAMTTLTQRQAQVSTAMRGVMIRNGHIKGE
jgi:hypothetical protein